MKKKIVVVVLSFVMAVSMMACGNSEKDFKHDLKIVEDIAEMKFPDFYDYYDEDAVKDVFADMEEELEEMEFVTEEGEAFKEIFEDVISAMDKCMSDAIKAEKAGDDDALDALYKKYDKALKNFYADMEDAAEDLKDAAEDAGADEEPYEECIEIINKGYESAGATVKDYENDLEVIEEIGELSFPDFEELEDDDLIYEVRELETDIKNLKFSTGEGKKIRNALLKFVSTMDVFVTNAIKASNNGNEDLLEELYEEFYDEMDEYFEDIENLLEDFLDAAEDAGVDEDYLEEFY